MTIRRLVIILSVLSLIAITVWSTISVVNMIQRKPMFLLSPQIIELEEGVCPGDEFDIEFRITATEAPIQILISSSWREEITRNSVIPGSIRWINVDEIGVFIIRIESIVPNLPPGRYERLMIGSVGLISAPKTLITRLEILEC